MIRPEEHHAALRRLREVRLRLARKGYLPATSGNLSLRLSVDPLLFAVTASGQDKEAEREDDGLIVDERLLPLEPTNLKPSAEAVVHARLYAADPTIGAILHIHTVAATVLSVRNLPAGGMELRGLEMVKALGFWEPEARVWLPVVPNHPDLPKLAESVLLAREERVPAVLMAGHGITAWGRDLPEALRHLEAVQFLLETTLALQSLP